MAVTCRHVQQLHDAYLDGELSSGLMAEVHAHVLQCPVCQQQIETIRACVDVIANDRSEPRLSAGFAARVVAALPPTTAGTIPFIETRRIRRRRLVRAFARTGLPAAAAALLFAALLYPQVQERPTRVAGEAVDAARLPTLIGPTIGTLRNTQEAATDLNRLVELSVGSAPQDLSRRWEDARRGAAREQAEGLSLLEAFFQPFRDLLEPAESHEGNEVIKF